ncbi:kinase-like domain-containing protein [Suillus fuscotomentosus]|uniref:Kinase-like domain-containing protein n=1 Tax=Suillus fuscotomentosus TaxID=1912939 RepID=A0AAD4E0E6_9AGAM|nr:kinase-like domain-containing protein [Suillus fuscotomentosus]KAG1897322.1 kinase-like domain-containing protein [Suillus fuscotomentosus]
MTCVNAESPVSPTRGWSTNPIWEAVLRILPSLKPPVNGCSDPVVLDQPWIDMLHHIEALQRVTSHEASEPINLHPIDGLPDLSGQIRDKGAFPDSIGGFSDVWKCTWIGKNMNLKKSRRLCKEAKIWATLEDAHILPLIGLTWGFGPLPALVCPWVENGSLQSYLELKNRDLSLEWRFHILLGLVSAISYLHSKDVVHGDITGSNILINGRGEPLLSDFGLSSLDVELTGNSYFTSCKPGNVRWAAPELLIPLQDGSPCRACVKSDIYSVGCVMLQVLSGRVPYDIWTDFMVINAKFNGKEPLRILEPPIDDRHWEFMRRCWRKKQERSVTVKDIADFIRRELDDSRKFGRL